MLKRVLGVIWVAFLSLFALGIISIQAGEVAKIKLRAAYHPNWGPMSVPAADMKKHFFSEEGLEIEWLKFTSGAPEVAAMNSGDVSFGYIGQGAIALCAEGRAEIISLSHFTNSEALLVRTSSGIKTMQDLKGKILATEFGTTGEVVLDLLCKRYGVSRSDINVVNMPITSAIAAFIGGSIDAIVAWGTDLTNIKANIPEELHAVAETRDVVDMVPFLGLWIATDEFVKNNPDTVMRILRALNNCYDYRFEDLDRNIQDCADFSKAAGLGVKYDDLKSERNQLVFFTSDDAKKWLDDGKMKNTFQLQLDYMVESGRLKDTVPVESYVRFDLMRKGLGMNK
ncbi:MAG: ABC transporter substrate-binding protein [Planctomycetota bacterium]|jgi:NitT/TauT family transport system substrate-binding protein|nr:ABC transporter substrate-binding protein [Planctomycetota bacterium]